MRALRLLLATAVAATIGAVGVPAAQADSEVHLHAVLQHTRAFPNPTGHSDYERSASGRDVEVTMTHAYGLRGRWVTVYVNYKRVGTMYVNRYGNAHRDWDSEHGQYVPWATAGDPVRVRTATGTLVLSGWYHREAGD